MTEPEPTAAESANSGPASGRRRRGRQPTRRHRTSVIGVFGEVFITAGVLVLLFLGWQVWWNNLVLSNAQTNAAAAQAKSWLEQSRATPDATPTPGADGSKYGTPPVMKPVGDYESFAVIYVPRFGADWRRVIKETVSAPEVLNSEHSGIGHYPGTQMPGQVGNFAIAGHVDGYGDAFINMRKLQLGDAIYIQTKDGWYTYRFRDFEYVQPSAVEVLLPMPREPNLTPTERILTMTTCNPAWASGERLISYSVFDSWQPLSAGPPAAIAAQVDAVKGQ